MSLQTRLGALISAVGADVKDIYSRMVSVDVTQTITSAKTFLSTATSMVPVTIKGNNPQTTNLLELRDFANTIMSRFNFAGALVLSSTNNPNLLVSPTSTTAVGIQVKPAAGSATDTQQWYNPAGALASKVTSAGLIYEGANRVYSDGNLPSILDGGTP